jgi:transcriptional regulator GlxA family with amidase domain
MLGAGTHTVAVLALPGVVPIDLGIPVQVFGARPNTPYRVVVCGAQAGVTSAGGFDITVRGTLADLARADTVVVPGYSPHAEPLPSVVTEQLAAAHARGARMVSICVGAFALAAAGVLDGRRVTTHWQNAHELAAAYPALTVDPDVLYVDDGDVLTSAGVSSGIDLCLHMVRTDLGALVANDLARALVAAPHRDGGQMQFIRAPISAQEGSSLATTRAWALAHLADPITVSDLARSAGTSTRTFSRRCAAETGLAPLQWLLRARVDAARSLLEQGDSSVERVAQRCGLGTAANLRVHFRRFVGTTPTNYRQQFRHG